MRKILILIGLCGAFTLQAQTTAEYIKQSRLEGDPAVRVTLLTQALTKNPNSALALHHRADAYREMGKMSAAIKDYSRAIELTPKDPFRYYARALAYMDQYKYTQALEDLNKAISLKKNYPGFYLERAKTNMALEKYAPAISDYEKYLKQNPKGKTPQISLHLAQAYIKTYKYPQAEKELLALEKQLPEQPDAYFWHGRMKQNQGLPDEAISFYSKTLNRDESFAPAYRYRAAVFKDIGELEASAQDYTQLVSLTPDPLFYNRRGLVYEEMEAWDKALADYNKAIELSPKWPIAYNNRGYIYLKQKKYNQARADFEQALRLDNTLPTPYINLAGTYWLQKKDKRNVYRNLEQALKRNFHDFESLYDHKRKGWMFEGINNTSEFRTVMYK